MATTVTIPIPPSVVLYLTANCHASWEQTLTYSTAETSNTFSGSGEGVAMTSDSQTLVAAHDRRGGGELHLAFSSSGNPNPLVNTPVRHVDGTIVQYTVTSEDDIDSDNNDTYAMFWWNEGTPNRPTKIE
ncbi:fucose-binding lectin II [Congregibacter brevis]|uniref:Fucose-binding lectin II n=1 Tax=Congregibacter brevis TaxID=3081201 RepID=A0ABZ0IHL2_9GAMM|nr:fucose-binding lectin II [Congregibacter sp. IMCC45268]